MHTGPVCPVTTPSVLVALPLPCPSACVDACHSADSMRQTPVCLGQKTCLAKKKSQLRAFHLERKRVRRIDLKANSRVFLLRVRAFPTLHWKECKEQMFPSACKHQTLLRSKEKQPVLLERGKNQLRALPQCSCLCVCSLWGDGFSRSSYVFWVQQEHQTLGYSDMRPGGACCPPQSCSTALEVIASSVRVPATGLGRGWWVYFPS